MIPRSPAIDVDTVGADHGESFDVLLDPVLHAEALAHHAALQQDADAGPVDVTGLDIQHRVGPAGLEPTTSAV